MNTSEKNVNPRIDLNTVPGRSEEYLVSEIITLLNILSERVIGIESLLRLILEINKPDEEINRSAEKSVLYKIEVKVDNLHRIFELAVNERKQANIEKRLSTKRARKQDLVNRKEKEMARTILILKKKVNQS